MDERRAVGEKTLEELGREAIAILDDHGWCKFALRSPWGDEHCLLGAINQACHGNYDWGVEGHPCRRAVHLVNEEARKEGYHAPFGCNHAARYNNDPAVSLEDVKLLIKRALC